MSWKGESTVGKQVWQSSGLLSPTKTLRRGAEPIGDNIEPVEGSRVDVETRNVEESLEEGIPTFEMSQKNPSSRKEPEIEDARVGVLFVSEIVVQGKPSMVTFDFVFLTQENADTTFEYENEPSPEVF